MKKNKVIIFLLLCLSLQIFVYADSVPVLSRIYGDPFAQGIDSSQINGDVGALDLTLNSSGSVSVDGQLSGGTAQAIKILSDGTFLVAMSKAASNSNVGKYTAEGFLVSTGFGSGTGIADLGASTQVARVMITDAQNRILVAGGQTTGNAGWLKRLNSDGSLDASFATSTHWQAIYGLAQQTSGETIAIGFDGMYAQIARYTVDGMLDIEFGSSGFVVLNGSASGSLTLPTATTPVVNVVIDAQNLIYIAYVDAIDSTAHIARFSSLGILDSSFATQGIADISYLDSPTSSIYMALDHNNNLVAAAEIGNDISVTSIDAATGGSAIPAFTDTTISSAGDVLTINNLITTFDGTDAKIVINGSIMVGSGPAIPYSRITRLLSTGELDSNFNAVTETNPTGTPGYNQFRIGTPNTTSTLLSSGLSPDGQIYVAGYQRNGVTDTGYVSRLYNDFNSYQIEQWPNSTEQGILDFNFGSSLQQTNLGIVTPFNGLYRGALQQKANSVVELPSGNLLVGMSGYSNSSNQSSMMLVQLLPTGVLNGSFGSGGKLTLPNITATNEYVSSVFQDGSDNIYIAGYADDSGTLSGIFRKYTSDGVLIWNAATVSDLGQKGLGVGLQGDNRILLFGQNSSTTGQLSSYDITSGALDLTFNASSGHAGYLYATDYGLNMGPVYGGIIADTGNFYIAYKNSTTDNVDVAKIFNAATGLDIAFGSSGVVQNLFGSSLIEAENIHVTFNKDYNVAVAASLGSDILVSLLNATDGSLNSSFNSGSILTITVPDTTSIMVNRIIGISDGTLVITGYDNGADDTMLVVRVTANGQLDDTFNSQGQTPGILKIQIGDQIANFDKRDATWVTVQSHTGANQGNLIITGYEQQFSTDATPIVMRVFGAPGTTEVRTSPLVVTVPGDFDPSYNGTGKATTYANGASSPTANQQVHAIEEMVGTNIMTVISDGIHSWTTQLQSDSTLDTSYGSAGSALIVKANGDLVAESVQGMVFDGSGNMLIFGNNELLGGYVKRVLSNGAMDTTFGGYTGNPETASYPVGTAYGVMSQVNGVAQLSNGNIVAVGNYNGIGMAVLLSDTGVQLSNFGVSGAVSSGINMASVSSDADDNIYISVGYLDNSDNLKKVRIIKLNNLGAYVTDYGVGGIINGALSDIDNYTSIRSVIDQNNKVVVAASFGGTSGQLAVMRFDTEGVVDSTFNGGTVLQISFYVTTTTVQLTSMVALENGKTLLGGYQYDATVMDNDDYEYVACIAPEGVLDGSFGSASIPGLVTFQIDSDPQLSRYQWGMGIQSNGGILLCGAESPALNEETPFTARLFGYTDIQAVPQFAGYTPNPAVPNILDPYFNGGVATTGFIATLSQGGDVVVDSLGRPIIGGYTTDGQLLVARFTTAGILDDTFNAHGIAQTTSITNLLQGQYVAVDSTNRVYIGGITNDNRFILARFSSEGVLDTSFGGGVVQSTAFANLSTGGHVTVNDNDLPIVGGMSSDGKLVIAQFSVSGSLNFISSVDVATLSSGGFVVTDTSNNIYVAGMTSSNNLVCAKFSNLGVIVTGYGSSGVASTGIIANLSTGGALGINSNNQIILAGQTSSEKFVTIKFQTNGSLDSSYGSSGIAYSNPVDGLRAFAQIIIDSQDRIVVGGYDSDGTSKSFIVARFNPAGVLDTVLSSTGMGTSGPIENLILGGYVGTNIFDNIFVGGYTLVSSLVVAELYSGEEHFVTDPSQLSPEQYKIYYYGNNPDLFKKFLGIELFARFIIDSTAQQATVTAVNTVLDAYAQVYEGQPGWNLVQSTYRVNSQINDAQETLLTTYPSSATDINNFFNRFNIRRAYFYPDNIV